MVKYDESLIQGFVDKLYKQAASIIRTHCLLGALVGVGAGLMGGAAVDVGPLIVAGGGAFLGVLAGYTIAAPKAFALRFQAQQLLLLMKIEENTRPLA